MRRSCLEPNLVSYNAALGSAFGHASDLLIEIHREMMEPDEIIVAAALSAAEWSQNREAEPDALERWRYWY